LTSLKISDIIKSAITNTKLRESEVSVMKDLFEEIFGGVAIVIETAVSIWLEEHF